MRQTEPDFIKALHELSSGIMACATDDLLQKVRKPLSPNLDPVYLYARNVYAEMANGDVFAELDSPQKVYHSLDTGDHKSLGEFVCFEKNSVEREVYKVMLISNISSKFVNGSTDFVKQLCDDSCIVSFDRVGDVPIKQHVFSVYSQKQGCNIATRKQLPLRLAYALTMHKAQGMTLDSAVVDVRFASQAGQVPTAIGRVRSSSFVQVRNLSQLQKVQQPQDVFDFSASLLADDTNPSANWLCCRNRTIPDIVIDHPLGEKHIVFETHDDILSDDSCESLIRQTMLDPDQHVEDVIEINISVSVLKECSTTLSPPFNVQEIRQDIRRTFVKKETLEQQLLCSKDQELPDDGSPNIFV